MKITDKEVLLLLQHPDIKILYIDGSHITLGHLVNDLLEARTALKFYADKDTYAYDGYDGIDNIINNDSGALARQALGEEQ